MKHNFVENPKDIPVEVAYGNADRQLIVSLEVPLGTTAYEAVLLSNIGDEFEKIDAESNPMGIFSNLLDGKSRPLPKDYVLKARDRVEIYRPLLIDPKQARRSRAENKKSKK